MRQVQAVDRRLHQVSSGDPVYLQKDGNHQVLRKICQRPGAIQVSAPICEKDTALQTSNLFSITAEEIGPTYVKIS